MTTLQGFPIISQLTSTSGDGSSPNAQMDCVPSCLLAGAMYLNGIAAMGGQYTPDSFLDMAYPEGYVGGTDAARYVDAMAKLGIKLSSLQANAAQLVVFIHQQIQQERPVLVTVPDIYVPQSYGWTHVLCAFEEEPGSITMLDPYIGKALKRSDAEWTGVLLNNTIWTMQRMEVPITITINTPGVANYFQQQDAQHWLCTATNRILQYGILAFYCAYGGTDLCGLTHIGLPMSNEVPLDAQGNTLQFFERCCLVYDPGRKYDRPPGSTGPIYTAHVYSVSGQKALGQDPEIATLQSQIATLQQELATAQNGVQLASLEQRLTQIKTLSTL